MRKRRPVPHLLGEVVGVAVWRCSRLLGESCLYPASAGGCRSLVRLLDSIPRAPVRLVFDDAPQRVAVVLVLSALDASCRGSVAAASVCRTIIRAAGVASEPQGDGPGRRSRAKDPFKAPPRFYKAPGKMACSWDGAWEGVVSKRFAPTHPFGVQIDPTQGSL